MVDVERPHGVLRVRREDVGDVRRLARALGARQRLGLAGAPRVATELVGLLHGEHHAVDHLEVALLHDAPGLGEGLGRRDDVALDGPDDAVLGLAGHVEGDVVVALSGASGAAAEEVDDAELAPLDRWVGLEHPDDLLRMRALLHLLEDETVVRLRPVHPRLRRRDADPRNDDGLKELELVGSLGGAGRRGDHDASGAAVHGDDGPRGPRLGGEERGEEQGPQELLHGWSPDDEAADPGHGAGLLRPVSIRRR